MKAEGESLGNLGIAYHNLGDYSKAIEHYQRRLDIAWELQQYSEALEYLDLALEIFSEIKDIPGQEWTLISKGVVYRELGEYTKAIECNQQHLAIVDLNQAKLYCKLGDRTLALEYCDRALSIATELGIPLAKECQELKEKLR